MKRNFKGLVKLAGRSSTYSRVLRLLQPVMENAKGRIDQTIKQIAEAPDAASKAKIYDDFMSYTPKQVYGAPSVGLYIAGDYTPHRFKAPSSRQVRGVFDPSGSLQTQYDRENLRGARKQIHYEPKRDIQSASDLIQKRIAEANHLEFGRMNQAPGELVKADSLTELLREGWDSTRNSWDKSAPHVGLTADMIFQSVDPAKWKGDIDAALSGWKNRTSKRIRNTKFFPAAHDYGNASYSPMHNVVYFMPSVSSTGDVYIPKFFLRHELGHGIAEGNGFLRSVLSGLSASVADSAAKRGIIPGAREATLRKMTGLFKHSPGTLGKEYRASRYAMDGKDYKDWAPELRRAYDTYLLGRIYDMNKVSKLSPREYRLLLKNYPEVLEGAFQQ